MLQLGLDLEKQQIKKKKKKKGAGKKVKFNFSTCSKHCCTAAATVQCPKACASFTKCARLAIDLSKIAKLFL